MYFLILFLYAIKSFLQTAYDLLKVNFARVLVGHILWMRGEDDWSSLANEIRPRLLYLAQHVLELIGYRYFLRQQQATF